MPKYTGSDGPRIVKHTKAELETRKTNDEAESEIENVENILIQEYLEKNRGPYRGESPLNEYIRIKKSEKENSHHKNRGAYRGESPLDKDTSITRQLRADAIKKIVYGQDKENKDGNARPQEPRQ